MLMYIHTNHFRMLKVALMLMIVVAVIHAEVCPGGASVSETKCLNKNFVKKSHIHSNPLHIS